MLLRQTTIDCIQTVFVTSGSQHLRRGNGENISTASEAIEIEPTTPAFSNGIRSDMTALVALTAILWPAYSQP